MKLLLKYKLLLISLLIISGCVSDKNLTDSTYFGGKIINPKSNQVFFYHGTKLLDSAKLNEKNKFIFNFDSLKVGLYTFEHGPEVQFVFLEPNDSLLMRLNTWDFDESLVYSGKGSERNNLLINIFLENEKEDKLVYQYYSLNDSLFENKLDSLLQLKKILYKHYKEDVIDNAALFEEFVNAAIYLPIYKKKEAYPYRNKMVLKHDSYPHMSPLFYKYRKNVDLNNKNLQDFYAYQEYIRAYLLHLSYEGQIIDKNNHIKVNFIESTIDHIQIDRLKNKFLYEGMWDVFLDEKISIAEKERASKLFLDNCNDESLTQIVKGLIKASKSPKKGSNLPNIELYSIADEKIRVVDIIKDHNTVIYFWPRHLRQIENLAKRVNYLEKQYPNIQFIGINSKNIDYNWKSYIKSNKFNASNQFRLDRQSTQNDWLFIDYSRTILVDKNGIIENGFTHLSNRKFEKQLKKLKKN
jgi:hypothetical protein